MSTLKIHNHEIKRKNPFQLICLIHTFVGAMGDQGTCSRRNREKKIKKKMGKCYHISAAVVWFVLVCGISVLGFTLYAPAHHLCRSEAKNIQNIRDTNHQINNTFGAIIQLVFNCDDDDVADDRVDDDEHHSYNNN